MIMQAFHLLIVLFFILESHAYHLIPFHPLSRQATVSKRPFTPINQPSQSPLFQTLQTSPVTQNTTSFNSVLPKQIHPLLNVFQVIWEFSRPHTLVGSGLSIICLYLYAVPKTLWKSSIFITSLINSLIPSLLTNIYITGLNQITDIEIDKVNKPYLPIVAGKITKEQAIGVIIACMGISSWMVRDATWPLQATVFGSAFLGTIYSLPPFRLKRYPLLAAFCILVVRGTLVNLGFLLQAKADVLGQVFPSFMRALVAYPDGLLITAFFAIFGIVIALMKDVPDIRGDTVSNIRTFSVKLGAGKMFRLSFKLLELLLVSASWILFFTSMKRTAVELSFKNLPSFVHVGRLIGGLSLLFFARDVFQRGKQVDADNSKNVFNYYMHIWKIFYLSYFLLPFIR